MLSSIVLDSHVRFINYNELCRNMHFKLANCFLSLNMDVVRTILVYDPHTRVIARYLSIIVDANLTFSFVSRLFSQLQLLDLMSRF